VFRFKHDVLDHHPDLLFVEFAVNDAGASAGQIYRCMEGIVRQTWKNDPATDICFVYTLAGNMLPTLQERRFPRSASAMERVDDNYGSMAEGRRAHLSEERANPLWAGRFRDPFTRRPRIH